EPVVQAPAAPATAILPVAASVAAPATAPLVVSVAASASPALPQPAPALPAARTARARDPDADQTPDLSDYVNPGEQPTMGQVIEGLHQAGIHTRLGAFPPPGPRPPTVGLAVP